MITPETMLIVAGAAFLLFGGKKLPELGRSLGHGIREFKNGTQGLKDELNASLVPESTHTSVQSSVLPSISVPVPHQITLAPSPSITSTPDSDALPRQVSFQDSETQRR